MVKVYEIDGLRPVIHPSAYVHPTAVLIGDVIVGPRCYVGPLASLRGDFGRLVLEEGANVQDTCVMHGFPEDDTVVEVDGHIGHGAVLLVGDAPYYARFGFAPELVDGLAMPGPFERARFLGLNLCPGSLDGATGTLRPTGAFAPLPALADEAAVARRRAA